MSGGRFVAGPGRREVREIDRELLIGRGGADMSIYDPTVSRRHAILRPVLEGVELEDLGSANGTLINGERVEGRRLLTEDTDVQVGSTTLRVEISLSQPTKPLPAREAEPAKTVKRKTTG
jgi:pSer/pThr/pTyr-binding forkhead associated (FHA) protein